MNALQSIVSRTADPVDCLVVSVTKFNAGEAYNVIPETAKLAGTVRTLRKEVVDLARTRMEAICAGIGSATGTTIALDLRSNYPVTVNDAGADRPSPPTRRRRSPAKTMFTAPSSR